MPCRGPTRPACHFLAWRRRRCQIGDVASINQTGTGIRLPNFCNLGVMLRSLLVANLFVLAIAVARTPSWAALGMEFLTDAVFAEPVLIASLVVLCAARRVLQGLHYGIALALAC